MLTEDLKAKWRPLMEAEGVSPIADSHKYNVTVQLLENQERESLKNSTGGYSTPTLLGEASPTNAVVDGSGGGQMDTFDPVLISMIRRAAPKMIAYDICGVQPMTGPTGLIFAMRSQYADDGSTKQPASNEAARREAFFDEADSNVSGSANNNIGGAVSRGAELGNTTGTGTTATDPTARATNYSARQGLLTAAAEGLGTDGNAFSEMAFSIEKVSVEAKSRALKAEYTMELAQDLKAVHGLDAEQELANILSTEVLAEINREVVRTINVIAKSGASDNVANAGTFDLDVDANGRWMVERFKGMMFQLEREANAIAKATRRGRGNIVVCSSDVASALNQAGLLDHTPALSNSLNVDDTGSTFVGVLQGQYKVFIDPYFDTNSGLHYFNMGYKGANAYDAGLFYCPYVSLQLVRAIGEDTFQPKIGFKTRYGMVANPYAEGTTRGSGVLTADSNQYYRFVTIKNLM